jgi:hypothetical protein
MNKIYFLLIIFILFFIYINYEQIIEKFNNENLQFHVLLATIGKKSIFNQLASLKEQLNNNDFLTIVYDAKDIDNTFDNVVNYVKKFKCKTSVLMEKKNLGYWGHGIRNKYNNLQGDFILHCDDDDEYTSDAFKKIRKISTDKNTLYLYRFSNKKNKNWKIWTSKLIAVNNIGTPNGIIPAKLNSIGKWGLFAGGDGEFYKSIQKHANKIDYVDEIIYYINK